MGRVLFSLTINNMFDGIESKMRRSLFADDGALWKRGGKIRVYFNNNNIQYTERNNNIYNIMFIVTTAITAVEMWSYK